LTAGILPAKKKAILIHAEWPFFGAQVACGVLIIPYLSGSRAVKRSGFFDGQLDSGIPVLRDLGTLRTSLQEPDADSRNQNTCMPSRNSGMQLTGMTEV
jgi:hypothetical protein